MSMVDGAGTTIVFPTSNWLGRVATIGPIQETRQAYDDTPLSATTYVQRVAGTLMDMQPVPLTWFFDPDALPPISGQPESVTITFPPKVGQINGARLAGTAFISEHDSGNIAPAERPISTGQLVFDGKSGPTWTPGS